MAAKKSTSAKKKAVSKKKTAKAAAPAKKPVAQKAAAKKSTAKKAASARKAAPKKTDVETASSTAAKGNNNSGRKNKHLTSKEIKAFHKLLLDLRDRVTDEITFLTGDNLNRSQRDASGDLSNYGLHMADQGTDNFDREFALGLVSNEQDIIYEIDEAIRRIDSGTYGICESSGNIIEKERLKVLPHARYCVAVQSELEKGKSRKLLYVAPTPLN